MWFKFYAVGASAAVRQLAVAWFSLRLSLCHEKQRSKFGTAHMTLPAITYSGIDWLDNKYAAHTHVSDTLCPVKT